MTKHAIARAFERCIPAAFGIRPEIAIETAKRKADTITGNALLILAHSQKLVKVGRSNGNNLCAVIRQGEVQTFLLRRDGQGDLDGLPIVKV